MSALSLQGLLSAMILPVKFSSCMNLMFKK
jgi:hypothetical protein